MMCSALEIAILPSGHNGCGAPLTLDTCPLRCLPPLPSAKHSCCYCYSIALLRLVLMLWLGTGASHQPRCSPLFLQNTNVLEVSNNGSHNQNQVLGLICSSFVCLLCFFIFNCVFGNCLKQKPFCCCGGVYSFAILILVNFND